MDLYCHDHETLAALRRAIYARLKARAPEIFPSFFTVLRICEILMTTDFFSPLSFVAVFGSGFRDIGWVKIRIRDKHPRAVTLIKGLNKLII
jgi:hypothetical protein